MNIKELKEILDKISFDTDELYFEDNDGNKYYPTNKVIAQNDILILDRGKDSSIVNHCTGKATICIQVGKNVSLGIDEINKKKKNLMDKELICQHSSGIYEITEKGKQQKDYVVNEFKRQK